MKDTFGKIKQVVEGVEKRNIKNVQKIYIKGKQMDNIGTFGIITAENPDSTQVSTSEDRKLNNEIKKRLKLGYYIYVPIDGHFKGNVEHSFLLFNIQLKTLIGLAKEFSQSSFFYCYPVEGGIMNEYWEKNETGHYELINKTTAWENEKDATDDYTIVGGDFKYTMDPSVLSKVDESIDKAADKVVGVIAFINSKDDMLDWQVNRVGFKSYAVRKLLGESIELDNE